MKSNNELIDSYISFKKIENDSKSSLKLKKSWLNKFNKDIKNKPFNKVTKQDIINHISNYKPNTIINKKALIIDFYRYILNLDKDEQLPKFLKNIPTPKIRKDEIEYRERCITENEYLILLEFCHSPKHKAILETLYNFGIRKSELISMNYKDVSYNGINTKITVRKSKTSTRDVIISGRSKHLLNWIETFYPDKDKPNQPLFYSNDNNRNTRYSKVSINKFLERLTKKSGLDKHITPHDFRHTSITNHLKNGIPDTHVKTIMGLSKDSKMLNVYDHNKLRDYEEYLKTKNKETPSTYEKLEEQKNKLEEEYQKQLNEIKENQNKTTELLTILFNQDTNELSKFLKKNKDIDELPLYYNINKK